MVSAAGAASGAAETRTANSAKAKRNRLSFFMTRVESKFSTSAGRRKPSSAGHPHVEVSTSVRPGLAFCFPMETATPEIGFRVRHGIGVIGHRVPGRAPRSSHRGELVRLAQPLAPDAPGAGRATEVVRQGTGPHLSP
ncbi:MAG: hypothetical protein FJ148_26555 [Deltaproteobacteria bacterium]|nr:hypothetical protein [Deltaproteobacteria bacterium]